MKKHKWKTKVLTKKKKIIRNLHVLHFLHVSSNSHSPVCVVVLTVSGHVFTLDSQIQAFLSATHELSKSCRKQGDEVHLWPASRGAWRINDRLYQNNVSLFGCINKQIQQFNVCISDKKKKPYIRQINQHRNLKAIISTIFNLFDVFT